MSEAQILSVARTTIPTMVVILIGMLINNACLNDVKDLLRAEIKATREVLEARLDGGMGSVRAEMGSVRAEMEKNHSEMLHRFGDLDSRLTRIEGGLGINRG